MADLLDAYRLASRARDRVLTRALARRLDGLGKRSIVRFPVDIVGEQRISIGSDVMIGSGSWVRALQHGTIHLDDGVKLMGNVTIAALDSVHIGRDVLLARGVFVSDFSHARADRRLTIQQQGVTGIAPVRIEKGAWLAQNVVVLPGVTIGRNSVVGANSVVAGDIPDFHVAVGAPARIVGRVDRDAAR